MTNISSTSLLSSIFVLASAVSFAAVQPTAVFAMDDDAPMNAPDDASKTVPPADCAAPPASPKPKKPPRGGGGNADDGGVLSGPKVPADSGEGNGSFGQGGGKGQRPPMAGGPMGEVRLFMGAVKSLHSQLTEEQRVSIEEIRSAFETSMREWMATNGEKIRQMRESMGEGRPQGQGGSQGKDGKGGSQGKGQPKGDSPEGKPPIDKNAMEEMQKLKDSMPNLDEARNQILALLTPEQKNALQANMAQMRKDAGKMDGEGKRPGKDGRGGKGGKEGKGGAPGSDKAPPPQDPPKGDYKFPD